MRSISDLSAGASIPIETMQSFLTWRQDFKKSNAMAMILQNLFEESKIFQENKLVETPYFKDALLRD